MKTFQLARPGESLWVLCLGAHADDIEIGAGGTILGWIASGVRHRVLWCVFSAGVRASDARGSALAFLAGAASARVEFADFREGFFRYQGEDNQQLNRNHENAIRA
jgi:LmbE family N-acetylglucosaminyl deacetylase